VILSILIFLPALGGLWVGLLPKGKGAKTAALLVSGLTFLWALRLPWAFDGADGGFQFREQADLVPALGVRYALGVDGLSLWLVLLTALITPLVVAAGFESVQKNIRGYFASVLFLESAVLGTFLSTDLFLFYVFWELMLLPAFFLIGVWGGENRVRATLKFVLYTMLGSLLMLVGILALTHETHSFDYAKIFDHSFPEDVQIWCFLAFASAFLIKVPLFPFHGWLADAYSEAPAGATVMLSAVLVKLGAYGLLRFCVPLFPAAAKDFAPWIMVLACAGVLHGALMASLQTNFKKLLAYSSLSHMNLVILGLFTFSLTGLEGGVLQMAAHGLYVAGLFLSAGMLVERRGSLEMEDYGGIAKTAPVLGFFFLWIMAAAVGLPGFGGFVGEILLLVSAYQAWPLLALLSIAGFVLAAWYFFNLYGKIFLGPVKKDKKFTDLSPREILLLLPLAAGLLWVGLAPNFFMRPIEKSLQLGVLEKLKPQPVMMDFAVQQRRLQEDVDKDKKRSRR
jgi:NADH-quinone oxidoreductase subunit M